MTVRSLCAIAAGVLALAFAGSVQAAPTGACLWSGMTAAERAAIRRILTETLPEFASLSDARVGG